MCFLLGKKHQAQSCGSVLTAGTLKGQGAIRSSSGATYCPLHGQGATEYLVLLAVVLIVALVSVALLGFFPGMASDSQITQSQMYWKSASPISIVESGAKYKASDGYTYLYLRLRNTGSYPIRLTALVGGDGTKITQYFGTNCGVSGYANISDNFYFGPGEEKYFAYINAFGLPCDLQVAARTTASTSYSVGGASSICQNSTASPGTLDYKSFGFEYIVYIDGQQITKKQVGMDWIVKCMPPI